MTHTFKLQDPGEGIHEAEILEVLVAEGDTVRAGDEVLVVETDKAAIEITVPVGGTIASIKVSQGDVASVGDVLMEINEENGQDNAASSSEEDSANEKPSDDEPAEEQPVESDGSGPETSEPSKEAQDDADAKSKRKTAAQGKAGQGKSAEEQDAAHGDQAGEHRQSGDDASDSRVNGKTGERDRDSRPVKATPAVRKLARDLGVDLKAIDGSGEDGRVLEDDVRAAQNSDEGSTRKTDENGKAEPAVRQEKLRSIRRATAKRMARSWAEIPHVVHADRIDITALERLRVSHRETVEEAGGKFTLTPLIVKALAAVLKDHPRFNARFDAKDETLFFEDKINIGVAVDTPNGLLVPVLRHADQKSVIDLAIELTTRAEELRNERPSGDVLKGGTFTFTNVGAIGGTNFSPIINHPQVALFGAARAGLERVIHGSVEAPEERVALMLPVVLAFDHRVVDGADAARFMNDVKRLLEDPDELMIHN